MSARKPLIITCSEDKTVRTWNYVTREAEVVKAFAEDPLSIAFHLSGLHCAIGFNDKIRLAHLLVDDLGSTKKSTSNNARSALLGGGTILAAANGTAVGL